MVHFSNHGNGETKAESLEDSLENVKQKKKKEEARKRLWWSSV